MSDLVECSAKSVHFLLEPIKMGPTWIEAVGFLSTFRRFLAFQVVLPVPVGSVVGCIKSASELPSKFSSPVFTIESEGS